MKIQKLYLSIFAMGATALVSCSDDDNAVANVPQDNSISFSTYVGNAMSRASAADINTLQNSRDGFGVFATWETGKTWEQSSKTPNFMNNQQVVYSGGAWTYSPLKYWPANSNEKVSFLAYAPYCDNSGDLGDSSGLFCVEEMDGQGLIAAYMMGNDITKQDDFLYATAKDKTNASSKVQFQFKHALTKIGFKVTGWNTPAAKATTTITINGISLSTQLGLGFFSLDEERWTGYLNADDTRAYIIKGNLLQNNVFTDAQGKSGRLNTDDAFIFTVPKMNNTLMKYCLMLDYTVETVDKSLPGGKLVTRNKVYRFIKPAFEMGKSYIININLGLDGNSGDDDLSNDSVVPSTGNPDPVDPNPEDPTIPTLPSANAFISFSTTVTDWDESPSSPNAPLGSSKNN